MITNAARPRGDPVPFPRYVTTHLPVRRFTVQEYHRLIEAGYFSADEKFELLEGWIVEKMSRNPPHDARVAHARRVLDRRLPANWHVRVQSAITTPDSEPEPDLAIVSGSELDYEMRHPTPDAVAAVIEVANTSLAEDREIKGRLYARAGIHVFWIINLRDRQIEVFTDPTGPSDAPLYRGRNVYTPGTAVALAIAGRDVEPVMVDELLG
jgi:Uma2 family endonuclease